jgi:hypothetical protein
VFDGLEPNQISSFLIDKKEVQAFLSAFTPAKTIYNIPWQEYRESIKLEQNRKRQAVPNAAAVQKLKQDQKLQWFLSVQALQYIQENMFSEPQLAYVAIILDSDTLIEQETKVGEFSQADLMQLIRRAGGQCGTARAAY